MTSTKITSPITLLRRVRMELARDKDHPEGSRNIGYDFVAPIDDQGHILEKAFHDLKKRCRVRRFASHEAEELGHLVRKPGGAWAFHYDIHGDPSHDETGYRLQTHKFIPGEYVSMREQDGQLKTFRVISVLELD